MSAGHIGAAAPGGWRCPDRPSPLWHMPHRRTGPAGGAPCHPVGYDRCGRPDAPALPRKTRLRPMRQPAAPNPARRIHAMLAAHSPVARASHDAHRMPVPWHAPCMPSTIHASWMAQALHLARAVPLTHARPASLPPARAWASWPMPCTLQVPCQLAEPGWGLPSGEPSPWPDPQGVGPEGSRGNALPGPLSTRMVDFRCD